MSIAFENKRMLCANNYTAPSRNFCADIVKRIDNAHAILYTV